MRIVFDQGTPAPLRRLLVGHLVLTAHERGWSRLSNGDLLAAAEAENFDALVTTDRATIPGFWEDGPHDPISFEPTWSATPRRWCHDN